jgi:hypothetical protein
VEEDINRALMMAHVIEVTEPEDAPSGEALVAAENLSIVASAAAGIDAFPVVGDETIRVSDRFLCNEERAKVNPTHADDQLDSAWFLDSSATTI